MPSVHVPMVGGEAEALVVVRNAEAPRVGQVMFHDLLVLEGKLVEVHDEVLGVDVNIAVALHEAEAEVNAEAHREMIATEDGDLLLDVLLFGVDPEVQVIRELELVPIEVHVADLVAEVVVVQALEVLHVESQLQPQVKVCLRQVPMPEPECLVWHAAAWSIEPRRGRWLAAGSGGCRPAALKASSQSS